MQRHPVLIMIIFSHSDVPDKLQSQTCSHKQLQLHSSFLSARTGTGVTAGQIQAELYQHRDAASSDSAEPQIMMTAWSGGAELMKISCPLS